MIEIRRKLARKTDVYVDERRLHLRLHPRAIEIWRARSHAKMLVPFESLWVYARENHPAPTAARAKKEDERQYWLEFPEA